LQLGKFLHLRLSWARICRGNSWYLSFHHWIAVAANILHEVQILEKDSLAKS